MTPGHWRRVLVRSILLGLSNGLGSPRVDPVPLDGGGEFCHRPGMGSKSFFGIIAALLVTSRADDWPQWLGPRRDGVWRESGILDKFPANGPRIRWRVPVGAGFAGPAVANGRVYLTDRQLKPGVARQANPFDRGRIDGTER